MCAEIDAGWSNMPSRSRGHKNSSDKKPSAREHRFLRIRSLPVIYQHYQSPDRKSRKLQRNLACQNWTGICLLIACPFPGSHSGKLLSKDWGQNWQTGSWPSFKVRYPYVRSVAPFCSIQLICLRRLRCPSLAKALFIWSVLPSSFAFYF